MLDIDAVRVIPFDRVAVQCPWHQSLQWHLNHHVRCAHKMKRPLIFCETQYTSRHINEFLHTVDYFVVLRFVHVIRIVQSPADI